MRAECGVESPHSKPEGFHETQCLWIATRGCWPHKRRAPASTSRLVDHDIKANTTELAQKIYVQNGNGRFVDADGHATLIKDGTLYIIDDTDKTYVVFDKATMEQLAKKISEAMEKMKEQLAQAAARAARPDGTDDARHVGRADSKWTVEVVDTGKSDKVDGRNCRSGTSSANGKLDDQICVVPYSASARQGKLPGHVREFRARCSRKWRNPSPCWRA